MTVRQDLDQDLAHKRTLIKPSELPSPTDSGKSKFWHNTCCTSTTTTTSPLRSTHHWIYILRDTGRVDAEIHTYGERCAQLLGLVIDLMTCVRDVACSCWHMPRSLWMAESHDVGVLYTLTWMIATRQTSVVSSTMGVVERHGMLVRNHKCI